MIKRTYLALIIAVVLGFGSTASAIDVSGNISTDTIWDIGGSPYNLVGDLQIDNGVTLTVEDGVVVNNPDGYSIVIFGIIDAQATADDPVVFNGVNVTVAGNGTVKFNYVEFNEGFIRNNLGFEHFTITNCWFNETSYLRINARTDSYFEYNTLTDAGYVVLVAYTSNHDRDIYVRYNTFYGKHPTLSPKSCFIVAYEGSDRLIIESNNFIGDNDYGISLHTNTSTVNASNNYWGTTDSAEIEDRINDSNDNASILGTVVFEPFLLSQPNGGTDVIGNISTETIWDIGGSPYNLVGDLQIDNGVTLTVEDGVVVNNPDGYSIVIFGIIDAQATADDPVVFNGVNVTVAGNGTVKFNYVEFNEGFIRNNLGFEHFTITNCWFNETSYLRINARTDSYFEYNTLTDAGYVVLVAYTSNHDRDIYVRYNTFYGKHPTLSPKSCFIVAYEGSDRLIIESNNFIGDNDYGISLHTNTSTVNASNNYWGTTDSAEIEDRINDSNDNASILGTVVFEPFLLSQPNGGTDVIGNISTETIWDIGGSPYNLVGDLQIDNGVTLTVEDGVVVNNPDGYSIVIFGIIDAQATADDPVVFNGVKVSVAGNGTVIFNYVEFNKGHIQNNLGFEHFSITNCSFIETNYLRINARTDSYFDSNTLTDAGYVELVAYTSNHDRDIYARWNTFYGKHATLALKTCFKVSYEGSDRLVIHSNNFLDENDYGISLHTNTSIVDASSNYWGTTDSTEIANRINDSNDNASIIGTVVFEPFLLSETDENGTDESGTDESGTDESGSQASNTDVEEFVSRFYQECLGREPDTVGLNSWVNDLIGKTRAGADVAKGFILSQEFINQNNSDQEYLTILYRAFFNREPDQGGYAAWMDQLNSGTSREVVLDGFINAQEFSNLCQDYDIDPVADGQQDGSDSGGTQNQVEAFVTRFYQQCLSREPEQAGLDSWVGLLTDGSMTGADLAYSFIFSPEFLDKGTTDAQYLTVLYQAFFNRAPDDGGYNLWTEKMNNGLSRLEVLNGFTGAQEFYNLCEDYGISPN